MFSTYNQSTFSISKSVVASKLMATEPLVLALILASTQYQGRTNRMQHTMLLGSTCNPGIIHIMHVCLDKLGCAGNAQICTQ